MPISVDEACLVSVVMEGVVYAISIVLLALAMRTLTFKGKPLFIFIVSVTLFVLSSAHLILNAVHVGTCCKEDDTSKCNSVLSHRIYTAKYAIYVAQTCAADGFVIWRSRLFSRTCIIAVPALLWVASFAVGITGTCFISKAEPNISAIFSSPCRPWMICFYVLTYSSHFSGTGQYSPPPHPRLPCHAVIFAVHDSKPSLFLTAILIIRVWSLFHPRTNLFEASRKLCRRVVMLLTGAHGLYAITIIALLVCYLCRTLGQVVVADMVSEGVLLSHSSFDGRLLNSALGAGGSDHLHCALHDRHPRIVAARGSIKRHRAALSSFARCRGKRRSWVYTDSGRDAFFPLLRLYHVSPPQSRREGRTDRDDARGVGAGHLHWELGRLCVCVDRCCVCMYIRWECTIGCR
ncbi:hypothetical protein SERLA73DRAFT_188327 [Serpula lacrymans var. lacrymans S7.3]|uniref:Uncharacterized protein n=1 Tax=Serpula lacrymans var. lacrymans (strain S7.3) TaxID=936435 RepID=F8QB42_SERL3|nr:hypothetical protein SERLA73DRAFT_188327 [Serpula lacrymans var. lacrymans S7.3]